MWQGRGGVAATRCSGGRRTTSVAASPLPQMSDLDRTLADYKTLGLTAGGHLMKFLRADLTAAGVLSTRELAQAVDGSWVKVAGLVIVRQRPGSAKGFCFLTLEDETGIGNAVVTPDLSSSASGASSTPRRCLQVEGPVQRVDDVIHVRAPAASPRCTCRARPSPRPVTATACASRRRRRNRRALPKSHDFR
jgi:error-prone DNA polymerase